jgi:hypothetical protein
MTKKTRRKIDAALKFTPTRFTLGRSSCSKTPCGGAFAPNFGLDAEKTAQKTMDDLYAKIGQLTVERDFSAEVWTISAPDRKDMLALDDKNLSIRRRQCALLGVVTLASTGRKSRPTTITSP